MERKTLLVLVFLILCIIASIIRSRSRENAKSCNLVPLASFTYDAYVINLPRDTTRMKIFSDAYKKSDLASTHSLIRFEGVVGKNVPIAEVLSTKALHEILRAERLQYRQKHYELTRGAVGCFLSHTKLWESILESDKDMALIFEDDCRMARNTQEILDTITIPADTDLLLLGYFCNQCTKTQCGVLRVKKFFGLHAYMLTRKGIQKILKNPKMQEINKQIDSVLSDMIRDGELNVYALPQPIAWQNGMPTTIQMQLKKVDGIDEWSDE